MRIASPLQFTHQPPGFGQRDEHLVVVAGRSNGIVELPVSEAARAALKDGWNTFAVHCRAAAVDGFVDVGLNQFPAQR